MFRFIWCHLLINSCMQLPVLKKCLFCIPLRNGLLVIGYGSLFFYSSLLLLCILILLKVDLQDISDGEYQSTLEVHHNVALVILIVDIIINVILVVGCHKENVTLLHPVYFYSIFSFIFTMMLVVRELYLISNDLVECEDGMPIEDIEPKASATIKLFLQTVFKFYVLLLVRSEIIKMTISNQLGRDSDDYIQVFVDSSKNKDINRNDTKENKNKSKCRYE